MPLVVAKHDFEVGCRRFESCRARHPPPLALHSGELWWMAYRGAPKREARRWAGRAIHLRSRYILASYGGWLIEAHRSAKREGGPGKPREGSGRARHVSLPFNLKHPCRSAMRDKLLRCSSRGTKTCGVRNTSAHRLRRHHPVPRGPGSGKTFGLVRRRAHPSVWSSR
jgi:hypothetical protein